ncbi:uncharacterized protein HMPREF1541_02987 [Cyphellophora europaea CBS 101466]|uniref:DJ-1/PfpI domain-containing protein n=1 Tax=Cyphellophora europaea (strain CBS 101466) TaxID=1220924 RepID=W2RZ53_CYPE1|nr:uncharacterized protein HMPREF1541_02987 [Cyphellophora europaea CBS 101466]ETN41053.1 hypothetical protein HMPREF1541_02987 [Cyphellophora europaea CBS 101466]
MIADKLDLKNPHRRMRVGVILVNSVTEILDVATLDIFAGLSKDFTNNFPSELVSDQWKKEALDVEFHWVNETGKDATLTAGITLKPTDSFETCPPLDVVLMGANVMGYVINEAEGAFIRKAYDECSAFITVCGGAMSALQAGILRGHTATAPRLVVDELRKTNPEVNWVEKRWVHDGKLWTSGALLNGTDLMHAFATEHWGGPGSYIEWGLQLGHYPARDVDYADVSHRL